MPCWAKNLQVSVCASLSECRLGENEKQACCIVPCRFVMCRHRLSKNLGWGGKMKEKL